MRACPSSLGIGADACARHLPANCSPLLCVSVFSFHYESLSFLSVCVSLLMLERESEDIDFFEVFFGVTHAGRWAQKKRKEKYGGGQQHRMR